MRRREFILALGGAAAAWPIAARARQPARPVDRLPAHSFAEDFPRLCGSPRALEQAGFVEGRNRWADGQYDRLPALASRAGVVRTREYYSPDEAAVDEGGSNAHELLQGIGCGIGVAVIGRDRWRRRGHADQRWWR
jgi:hypothetical protein